MNAFIQYLRDVKSELTHVSWPTVSQAVGFTGLVILIVVIVALVLGAADAVFTFGLEQII
ncbi:MAG: preprotein translocase subunit SecE [Candidatus Pacebacteria bacterium]|jgi:preprotein translocase SecE subunit|nr:preprotein translocase subunit SecE [Candidatus Paceibacterota bacterium]